MYFVGPFAPISFFVHTYIHKALVCLAGFLYCDSVAEPRIEPRGTLRDQLNSLGVVAQAANK